MPDGGEAIGVRLVGGIHDVEPGLWDACAGGDDPFVSHAFLAALEDSGSVGDDSGWLPRHLVAEDPAGTVLGVVPLYLKGHSFGEYVFDHAWADAWERAGGRYYPKLLSAVPFAPVTGPRLLAAPGPDREGRQRLLAAGLVEVARQTGVSSLHVNFPVAAEAALMERAGCLLRTNMQFHWENRGYGSFDDFQAALNARRRKAVRKERREVAASGVRLETLTGAALTDDHMDAFFGHYIATSEGKWGYPYMTRDFFRRLGRTLADRVVLVMAWHDGEAVASALNLVGGGVLYGRNWGCLGDWKFLHFEACYYQAIEYAIDNGLQRVEAGAQGPHKIRRGYLPVTTWSAHWIADPSFRPAVADFLERERPAIAAETRALAEESPYRRDGE